MRILPPAEEKIRRAIRDAMARDPLTTIVGLQQELEQKLNRTFDRKYLKKLCEKVHCEALIHADRTQLDERRKITREKFRLASKRLLKIINWTPEHGGSKPWDSVVVEAAKNLAMLDLALSLGRRAPQSEQRVFNN